MGWLFIGTFSTILLAMTGFGWATLLDKSEDPEGKDWGCWLWEEDLEDPLS